MSTLGEKLLVNYLFICVKCFPQIKTPDFGEKDMPDLKADTDDSQKSLLVLHLSIMI